MKALTKLLPTPSDRMGVIWNLLALKDSCVLEYGPAGTTHFGVGPLGALGLEPRGRYFVTHMDERDVVMGDTSRLERAVEEIDGDTAPEHLFIIGSSVSSTIGTDIKGVVFYLKDQVSARLHVFDSGGFDGNYLAGTERVYRNLAEIARGLIPDGGFSRPGHDPAKPLRYNILGASPDHYRVRSDINEIRRVFAEALGAELGAVYVTDGRIADLTDALQADFSLVLRAEAEPLAEVMEETGMPCFRVTPYGYQGTMDMLEAAAERFGLTIDETFAADVKARQNEIAMLPFYLRNLKKPLYVCSIGPDFLNRGLARAIAEAGLEMTEQLASDAPEEERIEKLKRIEGALVFGDSQSLRLVPSNNLKVTAAFPWLKQTIIAEHLPLMGIRGMDTIAEHLNNYISVRATL